MKLKLILTTAIVGTVASLLAAVTPAQAAPFAYVPNTATDSVSQFNVGAGGLLAPLSPATVATGGTPLRAAVSPDGRSLYVTNEISATSSPASSPNTTSAWAGRSRPRPRPPSPPAPSRSGWR